MTLLILVLFTCFFGLASSQFFYDVPMYMPVPVPQMVPVYVQMPVITPRTSAISPTSFETTGDGNGKAYFKSLNDKLPGGVGRGHVYEYHGPGHHEYSNSYSTSQSWGSPKSNSFSTSASDSSGFSRLFSNSWSSESNSHSDGSAASSPHFSRITASIRDNLKLGASEYADEQTRWTERLGSGPSLPSFGYNEVWC
ncbi:hypothetical protein RB195_014446 [Necator americanus]|uniref:Uncharacterized protein n=1 Tax=Necator americanus TaxID=51031 RepID=A0ABR1E077_NECAM